MGPLIITQFVVCGICLSIGLLHLAIYTRQPERKADLFFSLMCFFNAAGAFLEALTYRAVDIQTYTALYKSQISVQGCLWIAMAWFIALLTNSIQPGPGFDANGKSGIKIACGIALKALAIDIRTDLGI